MTSKIPLFLKFLYLLVLLALIVVLNESIVITEAPLQLQISDLYFIIGSVIVFLMIFLSIILTSRHEVHWLPLFIIILGFSSTIAAAWINKSLITFIATGEEGLTATVNFTLGTMSRFKSTFFGISSIYVVYSFLFVFPKLFQSKVAWLSFCYFLTSVLTGLIVYSVIKEPAQYLLLFTEFNVDYHNATISVFSNTNVFGYYLSLGIFMLGYIESIHRQWWHYIWMAIFAIALLLTVTLTSYVGAIVFISGFVLYDIIKDFKKHITSSIIKGFLLTAFLYFFVLFVCLSSAGFAVSLRDEFFPSGFESTLSRIYIWQHGLNLILGSGMFIGYGLGISNALLAASMSGVGLNSTNRFHNGWIDVGASGGLIGLAFYLFGIGFIIYRIFKISKYNPKYASTIFMFLAGILVQSLVEAKVLFKSDAMGTLGSLLLVFLMLDPKIYKINSKEIESTASRLKLYSLIQS